MRIAFLTTVLPGERRTGSEVVSHAFADALRSGGHRVTVLGYRRQGSQPPTHADDIAVGERPIETSGAPVRAAAWFARSLLRRAPYSAAKYRSRAYRAEVARLADGGDTNLIVVDHAQTAGAVGPLPQGIPVAYLAHNLEHELYRGLAGRATGARAAVLRRESRLIGRVERRIAERAHVAWALSDHDAGGLAAFGARATRVFGVPAGDPPRVLPAPEVDVALLGTWTWSANAAGLDWFCDEVLPALPAQVTVSVAGAGSERLAGTRRGLAAAGRVADALAFLSSASVVAVPSVAGGGVQVKTLDAIAAGREVVATPVAVRGLDELPETVTVAESGEGFAAALADAVRRGPRESTVRASADWTTARRRRFEADVAAAAREAGEVA